MPEIKKTKTKTNKKQNTQKKRKTHHMIISFFSTGYIVGGGKIPAILY